MVISFPSVFEEFTEVQKQASFFQATLIN